MNRELTCIGCPMGCRITVTLDESGKFLDSVGWSCNIGKRYAEEEVTAPKRVVTSLLKVAGHDLPLSVRTDKGIDKALIFDCLKEIAEKEVSAPVRIGDVLIPNVCGTDVSVIATREIR